MSKKESIKIKGKAMKEEQEMTEGDGFAFGFFNVAQSPVNKQCSPTLTTGNSCGVAVGVVDDGIAIKDSSEKGYMIAYEGDSISLQFPGNKGGPVQRGTASSLLCAKGCANGVVVRDDTMDIKVATKKGYMTAKDGDGLALQFPGKTRGAVQKERAPTLVCSDSCGAAVFVKENDSGMIEAGNLHASTFIAANKVYSTEGMAPTILCAHSGIAHPKIEVAGEMTDTNFEKEKKVYSTEGVSPTILARDGKGPAKIEIAGDLHIDGWHDCANEVNSPKGISPTVCAQANNTRIKIEVAGEMTDTDYVKDRKVYSPGGASPTILSGSRSKIEVAGELADSKNVQQRQIYSAEGVSPTICAVANNTRLKIEISGEMGDSNGIIAKKVYSSEGCAPTVLCAGGTGSKIKIEDKSEIMPDLENGEVASMLTPGREEKRQQGQRYKTDGTSFTVTCQDKHGVAENNRGRLRIRYLTPRECWRLQGFPDSAFEAARDVGMTKTALYTQAGNSIAVPCLEAIFKGIYIDRTFTKTFDITKW